MGDVEGADDEMEDSDAKLGDVEEDNFGEEGAEGDDAELGDDDVEGDDVDPAHRWREETPESSLVTTGQQSLTVPNSQTHPAGQEMHVPFTPK